MDETKHLDRIKEWRKTEVECAVRWASNILAEVLHNHGRFLAQERAAKIREALRLLSDAR